MTVRRSLWCALWVLGSAAAFACSSSTNDEATGGSTSSSSSVTSASGGSGPTTAATGGSSTTSAGGGGAGAGGPSVRLIAIGDTGEGNDDQYCVAHAMSAKCLQDGCDGVLLAGDNFYDVGVEDVDDVQWMEKFELPYDREGLNGLPFYVVLGNHDYAPAVVAPILNHDGNKNAQVQYSSLPVGDGTQPNMRHSDKWTMPAPYYDVVLGDGLLHLFALDGQDASNTQLNDMAQRVSGSTATWKLVFNHFPRYTTGDHQDDMDYLNFLLGLSGPDLYELLQASYCNADLFLTGHDHDREYMTAGQDPNCPSTHFIVSGAGAKVDTAEHTTTSHQAYFENEIEGFFYLIFEGNTLTIESYDKVDIADTREESDCAPAGNALPAYSTTITK